MEEKNESYKQEINLEDHVIPISMEQMKYILNQMEKSIYKIKCNIGSASGFLCLIPFPTKLNLLPTLITNNHVLSEKDIAIKQKIQCLLKDDFEFKTIIIDENRKKYTSEKYDTTIVEIKPKDDNIDINSFLEIDEGIFEENLNQKYQHKSIYTLHFPKSGEIKVSYGTIKYINEKNYYIGHLCSTSGGSSGGPLLNLNNYKVIGVHKGGIEKDKINAGTLIKAPIEEFYNNYNNIKKEKKDIYLQNQIQKEFMNNLSNNMKFNNPMEPIQFMNQYSNWNNLFPVMNLNLKQNYYQNQNYKINILFQTLKGAKFCTHFDCNETIEGVIIKFLKRVNLTHLIGNLQNKLQFVLNGKTINFDDKRKLKDVIMYGSTLANCLVYDDKIFY